MWISLFLPYLGNGDVLLLGSGINIGMWLKAHYRIHSYSLWTFG